MHMLMEGVYVDWVRATVILEAVIAGGVTAVACWRAVRSIRRMTGVLRHVFLARAYITGAVILLCGYVIEAGIENWGRPITPRLLWIQGAFALVLMANYHFAQYRVETR